MFSAFSRNKPRPPWSIQVNRIVLYTDKGKMAIEWVPQTLLSGQQIVIDIKEPEILNA